MSIKVQCEQCGAKRRVNERLAGRTIRCPGCESPLTIPALAAPTPVAKDHEPVIETKPSLETPALNTPMEVEPVYIPDPANALDSANDSTATVANDMATARPANGHAVVGSAASASSFGSPSDRGAAVMPRPNPSAPAASVVRKSVDEERPAKPDDDDDDLVPPRKKREDGELDMTPMVDVTFLLLIFFMVTASFSLQKSIQMPRQSSDLPSMSNVEEETEELDPIELEIDESGAFLVLAPEWERETPGKQNLTTALKEAIGDNRDGMKLDIKVHESAKLQMLVDGMDAGTIAGFTQIQVTEVDGFD